MKSVDTIRQAMEKSLRHVRFEGAVEVMRAARAEARPARLLNRRLVPAVALALLLLTATALAINFLYTPRYSAGKAARQAIMNKYGLSQRAMDVFIYRQRATPDGWELVYEAQAPVPEKLGSYLAVVDKQGQVTVSWSHDDVDKSVYDSGDMQAPVWGAKQLNTYYREETARRLEEARLSQAQYEALQKEWAAAPTVPPWVPPTPVPLTAQQQGLKAIADVALKDAFGFTEEDLQMFTAQVQRDALWTVRYTLDEPQDTLWATNPQPGVMRNMADYFGTYQVQIDPETLRVKQADWSLAGVDDNAYTQHTWGRARAYGVDMLPWARQLMAQRVPIVEDYPGGDAYLMSVADQAAYDQLYRDNGFSDMRFTADVPREGELTEAQATALAKEALVRELDARPEELEGAEIHAEFDVYSFITREYRRNWTVWFHKFEGLWLVQMDAADGALILVQFDPIITGNG